MCQRVVNSKHPLSPDLLFTVVSKVSFCYSKVSYCYSRLVIVILRLVIVISRLVNNRVNNCSKIQLLAN